MAELPRHSRDEQDRPSHGWRRSDRLVLAACIAMAGLEVSVLFALRAVVMGALS